MARILEDEIEMTERLIPAPSAALMSPDFQWKPGNVDQVSEQSVCENVSDKILSNDKRTTSIAAGDIEMEERLIESSTTRGGFSRGLRRLDSVNSEEIDEREAIRTTSDTDEKQFGHYFTRAVCSGGNTYHYIKKLQSLISSDQVQAKLKKSRVNVCSYLHLAAGSDSVTLVKFLIDHGANVNIRDEHGRTPLNYFLDPESRSVFCERTSDLTTMDLLTGTAGIDVNAQNDEGCTPLHNAVISRNLSAVARLLELPTTRPNIADKFGNLPLHYVRITHFYYPTQARMVRLLLDAVSRHAEDLRWKNLQTSDGKTPLHLAVSDNCPQLVSEILSHKVCTEARHMCAYDKDNENDTAMHYACRAGQYDICVQLLKHDVESVRIQNKTGSYPLDVAVTNGHYDVCALICGYPNKHKPGITLNALMRACESGQVEIVCCIVDNCNLRFFKIPDWQNEPEEERIKIRGSDFLSQAIAKVHKKVARYIVQDSSLWHNGLCDRVFRDGILDTPMRALVRTMPDVARQALNRCTDITDTGVWFNCEFVDDACSTWQPEWDIWDGKDPIMRYTNKDRFKAKNRIPYTANARVLHDNHVLLLIMQQDDGDDLLKHPLVTTLIGQKWRKLGRNFFFAAFFGYCLYVTLLTIYLTSLAPVNSLFYVNKTLDSFWMADACKNSSLKWPLSPDIGQLSQSEVCRVIEEYRAPPYNCSMDSLQTNYFTHFAQLTLLCSSTLMLTAKLALMFVLHGFNDVLACIVYVLAIVVTFPWQGFDCFFQFGLVQAWIWQVASINILFSYVHLALKLEFAPGLGIYVHMLRNVSTTMLRVLVAPFGIILSALALCFHMVFRANVRYDQHVQVLVGNTHHHSAGWNLNPFYSFPKAVLKTLVMLIGEYDLETHFTSNDVAIASFVLVLLILFGTIAIMNLLVGLAISDVGTLQDHAEVQQLRMQSRYALSMERLIRSTRLKNFPYFENLVHTESRSFCDLDGVTLHQTSDYSETLTSDQERLKKPVQSKFEMFWTWWYYKVLVGQRHKTNFRARLQEIANEKIRLAGEASQASKLAEEAARAKRSASEEASSAHNLTEGTSHAKKTKQRSAKKYIALGNDFKKLRREMKAWKFQQNTTVATKLDEIVRRLPTNDSTGMHTKLLQQN